MEPCQVLSLSLFPEGMSGVLTFLQKELLPQPLRGVVMLIKVMRPHGDLPQSAVTNHHPSFRTGTYKVTPLRIVAAEQRDGAVIQQVQRWDESWNRRGELQIRF
jgi:hypothetical protein